MPDATWGSSLTAGEFAAIRACGFDPCGQVMGACVHQMRLWSMAGRPASTLTAMNRELPAYEEAMRSARRLAVERMTAEARDAHGVVGVRLQLRWLSGARTVAELLAIGTAIRAPGIPVAEGRRPFLSVLSGEGFAKLLRAGYAPVGIGIGACALWVGKAYGYQTGYPSQVFYGEVPAFGDALARTREIAMDGLRRDLVEMRADGCVAADVSSSVFEAMEGTIVEFLAIATGVVRFGVPQVDSPKPILRLR